MRSLQTREGCSEGPRDPGRSSKTTPLPLYHCLCQLNRQKRKLGPCLPRSISGCVKTLSMLFCGSGYNSWNITAAGYWKMQISHIFRFQMQHSFLSQQKVGNIYIYRIFYYNSKIHSLKKKSRQHRRKKKKSKNIPFPQALSMLITFFSYLRSMLLDFSYDYLNLYPFSFKCFEVVPLYAFQAK